MSWHFFLSVVKALTLPPLSLFALGLTGLVLRRRHAWLGNFLAGVAFVLLYVVSTPLFSGWALGSLEPEYVDPTLRSDGQAIVLIAGGASGFAPEYGADTVSTLTLVRVRYAASIQRKTGKPLLVSGGSMSADTSAEADQMAPILTDEFRVPVRWKETSSRDTLANALESHRILAPQGIKTVYLVTHAWHMPRARLAFEHAGFDVIPAPTGFARGGEDAPTVLDFLPRASSLLNSYYFFHEVIGYMAYTLRIRL